MRKVALLLFTNCTLLVFSQESPTIKFGKIAASDLAKKAYEIDTGASAVVLYETGSTKIKGNTKGWFSLEFKIFRRIHILNKNGYDNATQEISLYTIGEREEQLTDLRASTYNLENGKVVETKLDKNSVFKEKKNKNLIIKKFTLPNVKEGSVIEYEYQISSDFLFNLQPWAFQGGIPVMWSEYKLALPQFLNYILISQGYQSFYVQDRKDGYGNFVVDQKAAGGYGEHQGTDRIDVSCGVTDFRWAMKDMPALKEEAYTSTLANYVSKIEFQLAGYQEPLTPEKVMSTWPDLADRLLKREDFGVELENTRGWLSDAVQPILQGASTETEKAKKLYAYVRDNFTCTDHNQLYTEQSLRNAFKNKNGGVAEINLLLTAMLRSAGISADPVILSTKGNGFVYAKYPVIGRFNYVISRAKVDGNDLLLDASYPQLGFAKLNYECYNGKARIINAAATELDLGADKLTENKRVTVDLLYDKNEGWTGKIIRQPGYYGSVDMRKKIKAQGEQAFFSEMAKGYDNEVLIEHPVIDSLTNYEGPLTLQYTIKLGKEQADILYMNPILVERYKQNPFKSADREYPVEIPYKINEVYMLTLAAPEGYIADELPKPVMLKMNDSNDAVYEYSITQSGGHINLRCWLQVNKTTFKPSEYNRLREFFNQVVAKQNEQIVFKKK